MNWKAHRGLYIALILVFSAIVIFILMMWIKPSAEQHAVKSKSIPVFVKKITVGKHSPQIMLYGVVESTELAKQNSKLRGDVQEVLVKEGQKVKQGQLLVKLAGVKLLYLLEQRKAERSEIGSQIEIEKQQFETDKLALAHEQKMMVVAQREFKRMESLAKNKYVSNTTMEKAEAELARMQLNITQRQHQLKSHQHKLAQLNAQLKRADAMVGLAQRDYEDSLFYAPFDGQINNVYVSKGGRIEPGQPIVEVLSYQGYRVRATLPNSDVPAVNQALDSGQTIHAKVKWQQYVVSVTLRAISANVESGESSKDALFVLKQEKAHVALGQTVMVYLPLLPIADTAEIPLTALYGNNRVYIVVDGKLKSVAVQRVGDVFHIDGDHDILVSSKQLKTGDLVLVSDLPSAINGLAVSPQP